VWSNGYDMPMPVGVASTHKVSVRCWVIGCVCSSRSTLSRRRCASAAEMVVDVELDVELDVGELVVDVAAGTSAVVLVVASCPVSGVDAGRGGRGRGAPATQLGRQQQGELLPSMVDTAVPSTFSTIATWSSSRKVMTSPGMGAFPKPCESESAYPHLSRE